MDIMAIFQIVRMGKYFYYWILQGIFFLAMTLLGSTMMEPDAYDSVIGISVPTFITFAPIFIVFSFIIIVVLYTRAWLIDGRKHWVCFAVFILIISAITSTIILNFDETAELTFYNFIFLWGIIGLLATIPIMPFSFIFKPRLKIKERPTSID